MCRIDSNRQGRWITICQSIQTLPDPGTGIQKSLWCQAYVIQALHHAPFDFPGQGVVATGPGRTARKKTPCGRNIDRVIGIFSLDRIQF